MLLTKISCCYVMKERKGPCLRYQAFHVEISTKMEIWTLAAFIGYDRQGLLLASKDTVTSQLLDVSLLIDQTNLLWTVANGLDKIVVGFIKNGLNGLSSSLKNDFLQRKSLKNKQTNKQTDRQKQKKEKTPKETKQNKTKGKKKKKTYSTKTFTTTVPWNFNLICFISFWRFFGRFTERVIPSKIWSFNHVTQERRLNVTSTRIRDITVRNRTELVACLWPFSCIICEEREVVRMLIFFSLCKNGPR